MQEADRAATRSRGQRLRREQGLGARRSHRTMRGDPATARATRSCVTPAGDRAVRQHEDERADPGRSPAAPRPRRRGASARRALGTDAARGERDDTERDVEQEHRPPPSSRQHAADARPATARGSRSTPRPRSRGFARARPGTRRRGSRMRPERRRRRPRPGRRVRQHDAPRARDHSERRGREHGEAAVKARRRPTTSLSRPPINSAPPKVTA